MTERIERWTKKQIRRQLQIVRGERAPTIVLQAATYLNSFRKCWLKANIWIDADRIIYVGDGMPLLTDHVEVVDCSQYYIVPGYIEHHAHPYQLYNPLTLAEYASIHGTTTLINDNLAWLLNSDRDKTFAMMEELTKLPTSMYWSCRFDSQTELTYEDQIFTYSNMKAWLEHPLVVQGGELSSWPKVLQGDDSILHWVRETKLHTKPIEGHLPGASEKTLMQMALVGVNGDHESITAEEVIARLNLGYTASLRYSSTRPDLPNILDGLLALGIEDFSQMLLTTDGSNPEFYENGFMDRLIKIALEKGVRDVEAYAMATSNVARHYRMENCLGTIAPGRLAHLNILEDKNNPTPTSVLAKGQWIKKNHQVAASKVEMDWRKFGVGPLEFDWDLEEKNMHFSMPMGIELVSTAILKPYQIKVDVTDGVISDESDESFFMLIDRNGNWLINTVIKGFAKGVKGLASSYNATGDMILIGKNRQDMLVAFRQLKAVKGGIVLVENNKVISQVSLPLLGLMSTKPLIELAKETKRFAIDLRERGYRYDDPLFSLFLFTATHLPYVRVTQRGIWDVKKKTVLFPSIMR